MALVCDLTSFGDAAAANCAGKGGIKRLWLTACENIDWDDMTDDLTDALNTLNQLTVAPTMLLGAVFQEIFFRKDGANYNWSKPSAGVDYDAAIITIMNGHDAARTQAIRRTLGCCCLAGFVLGQDDVLRFFGWEFDEGEQIMMLPTSGMRLGVHLDTSGDYGADELNLGRDEITWTGRFAYPMLYTTLTSADIPVAP